MSEEANVILDIGNTAIKMAQFLNGTLIEQVKVFDKKEEPELVELLAKKSFTRGIVSSVRKELLPELQRILDEKQFLTLSPTLPIPLLNNYATPLTLGMDRVAAAVGATTLTEKEELLVIDMGTCITIDRISAKKEFLGGTISPGYYLRAKALHNFTAKLPFVHPEQLEEEIPTNTNQAVLDGVMNGVRFELEGRIGAFLKENPSGKIILTGGDHHFFAKALKNPIFADPELVVKGLNKILDFNYREA